MMENNVNLTSNFLLHILILFGTFTFVISSVNSNENISEGECSFSLTILIDCFYAKIRKQKRVSFAPTI